MILYIKRGVWVFIAQENASHIYLNFTSKRFNVFQDGLKLFKNSLITSYKDINQI